MTQYLNEQNAKREARETIARLEREVAALMQEREWLKAERQITAELRSEIAALREGLQAIERLSGRAGEYASAALIGSRPHRAALEMSGGVK